MVIAESALYAATATGNVWSLSAGLWVKESGNSGFGTLDGYSISSVAASPIHNIPVYRERIKTDEFYALFENKWKPDLCIMAIFGQLVSPRLFNYPLLGFYNMHPTFDDIWPAFGGCNPMEQLIAVNKPHYVFAIHHVEETFDSGKLVAYSDKIFMPREPHPVELFKLACDPLRSLLRKELPKLLA